MNLEICLAQQNRDFISQMAKAPKKGLYPRSEDPGFYALYYKYLIAVQDLRSQGDYSYHPGVSENHAREAISWAAEFIQVTKAYLEDK